jgi:hypothetical protein
MHHPDAKRDRYQFARDRMFASITAALESEGVKSPFYLALKPRTWEVEYFGTHPKPSPEKAERLRNQVSAKFGTSLSDNPANGLLSAIVTYLKRSRWTPDDLEAAAVDILRTSIIRLGSISADHPASAHLVHWVLPSQPLAFKFFQDALDFAGTYKFDAEQLTDRYPETPFTCHDHAMKVSGYVRRAGLIADETTLFAILAEYLTATKHHVGSVVDPNDLDHYFVPLKGLGQWRASACWIKPPETSPSPPLIRESHIESWQHIFTDGLVDDFSQKLNDAVARHQENEPGADKQICFAFADLWWARDVSFFRNLTCVQRLGRSTNGTLAGSDVNARPISTNNLIEKTGRGRFGDLLCLNLQYLGNPTSPRPLKPDWVCDLLGFDQVLFEVPLFTASKEELDGFGANLLGPRIESTLRLCQSARIVSRLQAIEAVTHGMKNTVQATGWRKALQSLMEVYAPSSTSKTDQAVARALQSLTLFEMVEGLGGLMRLWGLCERMDYGKVGRWTDASELRRWNESRQEDFDLYVEYLTRFVAALCWGLGKRDGFDLVVHPARDHGSLRRIRTDLPQKGSISNWLSECGAPPPLHIRETQDGQIALFSSLIEPVRNAVRQFESGGEVRWSNLSVTITSNMPRSIDVLVANELQCPLEDIPSSIKQISYLFQQTRLAEIICHPTVWRDGQPWCEVIVSLTPHELAKVIVEHSTKRGRE